MKNNLFFLLSCFIYIPFFSFGQQKAGFCTYYGDNSKYSPKDISGYLELPSNAGAEKVVDDILKKAGLERNFKLTEGKNIENCMAINLVQETKTVRSIVYNNAFLNKVQNKADTDWASTVGILAHEIGHHLQDHSLAVYENRSEEELQADKFSGFILRKIGASLPKRRWL